jgi:DNA-directed RNA polymerase specialized sigma24 family protein
MSAPQTHNPDRVQTPSDEALVAHAQLDPTGFDAIFDRYWNPVLRYCYYRLGDWHQAEDAAAQVFLNALAALPGSGVRSPSHPLDAVRDAARDGCRSREKDSEPRNCAGWDHAGMKSRR